MRGCLSTVHSRPGAKGHPLAVTHAWRERPAALSCPMPPSGRFPAQRHFRDDAPFQQFDRGGEVQLYMRIGIQPGQLMVDPARWPARCLRRCRRSSWGPRSDVVAVHAAGPPVTVFQAAQPLPERRARSGRRRQAAARGRPSAPPAPAAERGPGDPQLCDHLVDGQQRVASRGALRFACRGSGRRGASGMTTLPLLVALAEAGEQDEGPADWASPEGARRAESCVAASRRGDTARRDGEGRL